MKWKLARFSGIDVYIHWSFWLIPVLVLYSAAGTAAGLLSAINTLVLIFAVFGCVVLHEFGHALAARYYGIGTQDITLYPIGGVASLQRIPTRPSQELVIALAGPAVNVAIGAGLLLVLGMGPLLTAGLVSPWSGGFLTGLLWVNVMLVVFNMLPAFPMDGGRVLRALLAMFLPYRSATEIAGRIGQGMAVLLGMTGLFFAWWSLMFVAAFVYLAATAELARNSQLHPFAIHPPGQPAPQGEFPKSDDDIIWVSVVRPYRKGGWAES